MKKLYFFLLLFLLFSNVIIAMEEDSSAKTSIIQTNDPEDKTVTVSNHLLEQCGLFKKLLNDIDDNTAIPLHITAKNFTLFLEALTTFLKDKEQPVLQQSHLYRLKQKQLIHLINTIDYLDCTILLSHAIHAYAFRSRGMNGITKDNQWKWERHKKLAPEMDALIAEQMMKLVYVDDHTPYLDCSEPPLIPLLEFFIIPVGKPLSHSENIYRPITAFSPDGSQFAAVDTRTDNVLIWDTKTGIVIHNLQHLKQSVNVFERYIWSRRKNSALKKKFSNKNEKCKKTRSLEDYFSCHHCSLCQDFIRRHADSNSYQVYNVNESFDGRQLVLKHRVVHPTKENHFYLKRYFGNKEKLERDAKCLSCAQVIFLTKIAQKQLTGPLHYRLPDGTSIETHMVPEYASLPQSFKKVIAHNFDAENEILPIAHNGVGIIHSLTLNAIHKIKALDESNPKTVTPSHFLAQKPQFMFENKPNKLAFWKH